MCTDFFGTTYEHPIEPTGTHSDRCDFHRRGYQQWRTKQNKSNQRDKPTELWTPPLPQWMKNQIDAQRRIPVLVRELNRIADEISDSPDDQTLTKAAADLRRLGERVSADPRTLPPTNPAPVQIQPPP